MTRQQHNAQNLRQLLDTIAASDSESVSIQDIEQALHHSVPRRTLQFWLARAVEHKLLRKTGEKRGVRYFIAQKYETTGYAKTVAATKASTVAEPSPEPILLSEQALRVIKRVQAPLGTRSSVGYQPIFLQAYQPNKTSYLSPSELAHLASIGTAAIAEPAGTFARQLLSRLLIDLSWNSSRLEGNTYSLLDTRRLIQFGAASDENDTLNSQMILNHKDAIEFLVDNADEIAFNHYTILNLHGMLSNNLLANPHASGRLRRIEVGIGRSVYQPLSVPQQIEDYFAQTLQTAEAIRNPFEQALFALIHLPYLQAFDDVNKRVSRLAANIPLIKHNLIPLSFVDVPKQAYTDALIGVYEFNQIEAIKEVFIWAYERSARDYTAVRQTLGEPDEFKLRYRDALKTVVSDVVLQRLSRSLAFKRIVEWTADNIPAQDAAQFQEAAETELLALHIGNIARFKIRPSQFEAWMTVWNS
ncbi:MAG: Fic family protein [Gammaproteobacteria bacterium]|nr:Fic family protein [Gammaproteobacteria bacterium]